MQDRRGRRGDASSGASDARRRFIAAVAALPGYAEVSTAPIACLIVVCPCAMPCRINLCGLLAIRFERPPPRTPTLEEAEATVKHYQAKDGTEATIEPNEDGTYNVYRTSDNKCLKSVRYSPADLPPILQRAAGGEAQQPAK